jgi:acetamidase/formamidase
MATYQIEPERATLHGHFSRDLPPVLTIESGDTVVFRTLDAGWNLESAQSGTARKFSPRDAVKDDGHALCGPVAVNGAEPGMTLAVEIKSITPGTWGWGGAGGWPHPVNERLGLTEEHTPIRWYIDPAAGTARNQFGHAVTLHPFMGVMGMPTDEPGLLSTSPPRITGGNIDCRELVAGSTLYLPIAVAGGLFSVGDGHGAQGDGEVSVLALECPMERVELTFQLLPDLHLAAPRAETPVGWLTLGLNEDLNEATYLALDTMLDLMIEIEPTLTRAHALALASVIVDLRITQIVNGVRGVHAVLPHGALRKAP